MRLTKETPLDLCVAVIHLYLRLQKLPNSLVSWRNKKAYGLHPATFITENSHLLVNY